MDEVKFGIFTDLHYDHIPDGERRLKEFMLKASKKNVDFIVELGDFCYPIEKNRPVLKTLERLKVPCYYTIGNHDSDAYYRDQILSFFGLENNYYSFKRGSIKFIVLDACYIKRANGYSPYYKRNYSETSDIYPYIPPEEICWLENELKDDSKYYVVFSHQSLTNEMAGRGIANRVEVREILEKANRKEKRVLMCMNGHDHGDAAESINGIFYYTLNAMSYIWHGLKETYNYPKEIHERYPGLKDMILYEEGLHAFVTIKEDGQVFIEGMKGSYQNVTPSDVGIYNNMWNGVSIKPIVSSIFL